LDEQILVLESAQDEFEAKKTLEVIVEILVLSKAAIAVAKNKLDAAKPNVENMERVIGILEEELKENLTGDETDDE